MKKTLKKVIAVAGAVTMLGCSMGALAACGKKNKEASRENTLVIASTGEFTQKFSPLFATTAYDQSVVDLTTIGIITADRDGEYVLDGTSRKGETRTYNGKKYNYKTPGSLTVGAYDAAKDTTTYTIKIKDDLKFSDGSAITIDDYIFDLYCLCDSSYVGASTFAGLPIVGLDDYLTNGNTAAIAADMASLDAILKKISDKFNDEESSLCGSSTLKDYKDAAVITDAEFALFDKAMKIAVAAGGASYMHDYSAEEIKEYWGGDGSTPLEVWASLLGVDYTGMATDDEKWVAAEAAMILNDSCCGYFSDFTTSIKVGISTEYAEAATEVVKYISGVSRVDDYTLTVTVQGVDSQTNQGQIGSLNPLKRDYYGDGTYNYAEGNFGFKKGEMNKTVDTSEKTRNPVGAGMYKFDKYENGVVYLSANEYYWEGEANIPYIEYRYVTQSEVVAALKSGTIDIGDVDYSKDTVNEIKGYNSNGEVNGSTINTIVVPYLGYGYIGIQAELLKVGDNAASAESKALRNGYMTLMAAYRDYTVDSYYGDAAKVIEYPISTTSWACPQATDAGYAVAYSKKTDGSDIYTAGMTTEQRQAAALDAAAGYFKAAGFTQGADGKFTDVPALKVSTPTADGSGHPSMGLLTKASEALATIGVTLTIDEINTTAWSNGLDSDSLQGWVAAWQATVDPDMTQLYRSTSFSGNAGYTQGTNHYAIQDADLDALIDQGKGTADRAARKDIYKQAMDKVLSWGVELPVYQRSDATGYSTERIKASSMLPDITPYYGWMNGLLDMKKR